MLRRFGQAYVTAVGLLAGGVVTWFRVEVAPFSHLWLPLLAAAVTALVIAGMALVAGRHAAVVAALITVVVFIRSPFMVLAAAGVGLLLVVLQMRGRNVSSLAKPVCVAAVVFALTGLVSVVPLVDLQGPVAQASTSERPVFVILLDGYPRADILEDAGVDVSGFVWALEARGLDHYPDAYARHGYTHRLLTLMLSGVDTEDEKLTLAERRTLRSNWHLPSGFVTVAPPVGHVTIPQSVDVGTDGITDLDVKLIARSAFALIPGVDTWVMDAWRAHVDADIDAVVEAGHPQVFAHLMAPHVPFLYGDDREPLGPPPCWPDCGLMPRPLSTQYGLGGTIEWLNERIVRLVDSIDERWPDAVVVVFSDHGARFRDVDENHKVLLAARGVDFDDTP